MFADAWLKYDHHIRTIHASPRRSTGWSASLLIWVSQKVRARKRSCRTWSRRRFGVLRHSCPGRGTNVLEPEFRTRTGRCVPAWRDHGGPPAFLEGSGSGRIRRSLPRVRPLGSPLWWSCCRKRHKQTWIFDCRACQWLSKRLRYGPYKTSWRHSQTLTMVAPITETTAKRKANSMIIFFDLWMRDHIELGRSSVNEIRVLTSRNEINARHRRALAYRNTAMVIDAFSFHCMGRADGCWYRTGPTNHDGYHECVVATSRLLMLRRSPALRR